MRRSIPLVVVGLGLVLSGCGREGADPQESPLQALILAEDSRGAGPEGLGPILEALAHPDPDLQVRAVRALGRLEDPAQIETIAGLLSADDPQLRVEAVNALGQSVFGDEGDRVGALVLEGLAEESDPAVRGVMGRTLGRLRYVQPTGVLAAEAALVSLTREGEADAALPSLLGAVLGLESLARQNRGTGLTLEALDRLRELTAFGRSGSGGGGQDPLGATRVRRTALMALTAASAVREETILEAMADPDADVRRLAVVALGRFASLDTAMAALEGALTDPAPRVRMQAVGAFAAKTPPGRECHGLFEAAGDAHPLVAVAALDLLNRPCPDLARQIQILSSFVQDPDALSSRGWHRGGHALVALTALDPESASSFFSVFAGHASPFARVYAAQAATLAGDLGVLRTLVADGTPNVRTGAVRGLFQLQGHEADGMLLSQLRQDDPQLILTVAGLLEGTPHPSVAVSPLLETFQRISSKGWETLRDPRMAILERLAEVVESERGEEAVVGLTPYLSDYDPRVADRVAGLLTEWTGETHEATPRPSSPLPIPSQKELDDLARARVILDMEGGGELEIRLFPHLAPTNAARFARLAESGTLDGLTFHRVVANFVLQGGSPNANEMAGHGAYTRDEIGLQSNWRGTVGTSTRGRDTGDGQFFVNLVDNLRLDHNYTIFGEVSAGMDVVDRVVEGQKILRASVEMR